MLPRPRRVVVLMAGLALISGCPGDPPRDLPDCTLVASPSPCQDVMLDESGSACIVVRRAAGEPCGVADACQTATTCNTIGMCLGAPAICDDGDDCTVDGCDPTVGCVHGFVDTLPCDDGDPCTEGDRCEQAAGGCVPGINICKGCELTEEDTCDAPFSPDNACDGTVACVAGKCQLDPGQAPEPCDTSENTACSLRGCSPETGECVLVQSAAGTPCDDGNPCTSGDVCDGAGTCTSGDLIACNDDDPCTEDVCDASLALLGCLNITTCPCDTTADCNQPPFGCLRSVCVASECVFETVEDAEMECDNDPCTHGDQCLGGICRVGQRPDCDDDNSCTVDLCDAAVGDCVNLPGSAPCDDGEPCTIGDKCTAGECSGWPNPCDDGVPCTLDACEAGVGCVHVAQDEACPDSEDEACLVGACDAQDGCELVAGTGMPCEHPDACVEGGTCDAGVCNGGSPRACDDEDPCTHNQCDEPDGCSNPPKCGDDELCTQDLCDASTGECDHPPVDCDDDDPCTTDACNPTDGACVYGPVCEDEHCIKQLCVAGDCTPIPVPCDDGHDCTVDVCMEEAEGCVFTPNDELCAAEDECSAGVCSATDGCSTVPLSDTPCTDDGNPCTVGGTCEAGVCKSGTPDDCDDGDPCTDDSCKPGVGCDHAPKCVDGDACTEDVCEQETGGCNHPAVACDDGDPCTIDSCEALTGACVTAPKCPDQGVCLDTLCEAGECSYPEKICDDGDECTVDACEVPDGCVTSPVEDGTPCDDGIACEAGDTCVGGVCEAGEEFGCDTGNHCLGAGCNDDGSCYSHYQESVGEAPPCGSLLPYPCNDDTAVCEAGKCGQRVAALDVGHENVCVSCWGHGIRCWGDNEHGVVGGVGDGPISTPSDVLGQDTANFRAIAVGDGFACVADDEAAALCWGRNDLGQLGRPGGAATTPGPVALAPGASLEVAAPAIAAQFASASSRGVRWGDNSSGQLQPGGPDILDEAVAGGDWACFGVAHACYDASCAGSEILVEGVPSAALGDGAGQTLDAMAGPGGLEGTNGNGAGSACGAFHACTIADPNKGVWCWGTNNQGQLGTGGVSTPAHDPTQVVGPGGNGLLAAVEGLAAGDQHTCALVSCDSVHCWGNNDFGQLGSPAEAPATHPLPFKVPDGVPPGAAPVDVSAAGNVTCIALSNGGVVCAGDNTHGLLGPDVPIGESGIGYLPPELVCPPVLENPPTAP